jgi:hypothetical protein
VNGLAPIKFDVKILPDLTHMMITIGSGVLFMPIIASFASVDVMLPWVVFYLGLNRT